MKQPTCEQRRALWVFHEELARAAFERWKQRVKGLYLARRQGPRTQVVEYPFARR
jgi:hypothetical protein